jgi:acyl-CoA synthetase (AMP-forming)/AMP-acid ligase II
LNPAAPFLERFGQHPERLAVVEPDGRETRYGDLLERSLHTAWRLHGRGVAPGDRVVLQVPNGPELAGALLGCLHLGAVPVLIEPGAGDTVYRAQLDSTGAAWLLVHPLLLWVHRLPGLRGWLGKRGQAVPPLPSPQLLPRVVLDRASARGGAPHAPPCAERDPSDDAVLVFTGGTTSDPKCVRLSVGALEHYFAAIFSLVDELEMGCLLADTAPQMMYGLRRGLTVFTAKGGIDRKAHYTHELIRGGRIDTWFGSPYIWKRMMALEGPDRARLPASMRNIVLGSAPVTPEFLDAFLAWIHPDARAIVLYGLTEVGPVCSVPAATKLAYRGPGDLVGAPMPHVRLELLPPDERAEPSQDVGQVVVHSPSLFSGYLNRPERGSGEGLLTGDLGSLVEVDGTPMLALAGRQKDMILRHSVNIYPLLFETELKRFQDAQGRHLLQECALVGLWDEARQDERVVLCYAAVPGVEIEEPAFARFAREVCGQSAAPDHLLRFEHIPVKGRQHKVDKPTLRSLCRERLGLPAVDPRP